MAVTQNLGWAQKCLIVTEVVERVSIPFDIYLCPHNLKYVILLGLLPPPFIPQHAF